MLKKIHEKNRQNKNKLRILDITIESLKSENHELENKLHNILLETKSIKHEQVCNMCQINSIVNHINICKILIDNDRQSKCINDNVNSCEEQLQQELKIIDSSIRELRDKRRSLHKTMISNDKNLEQYYDLKNENDEDFKHMKKQYDTYNNIQKRKLNIDSKINKII